MVNQGTATTERTARPVNVGETERMISAAGGGLLALYGLTRGSLRGLALAAVGAVLGYRGVTGHCDVYEALGIDRASGATTSGNLGVKIDRSVTVGATPERLYGFWRNFQNLPRIMSNLEQVTVLSETRSRWVVRAPIGMTVEWEAEIINDKPFELIAWRSIGNALVEHAGSVHFRRTADGRSTIVDVSLQYDPPGGEFGHAVASVFNDDAGAQIDEDLKNFKRATEEGRVAA